MMVFMPLVMAFCLVSFVVRLSSLKSCSDWSVVVCNDWLVVVCSVWSKTVMNGYREREV